MASSDFAEKHPWKWHILRWYFFSGAFTLFYRSFQNIRNKNNESKELGRAQTTSTKREPKCGALEVASTRFVGFFLCINACKLAFRVLLRTGNKRSRISLDLPLSCRAASWSSFPNEKTQTQTYETPVTLNSFRSPLYFVACHLFTWTALKKHRTYHWIHKRHIRPWNF